MLRELEYRIENLAKPLADLDITKSGSWVGVTDFADTEQCVFFGDKQILLPEKIKFPKIRSIDDETALVVDSRAIRLDLIVDGKEQWVDYKFKKGELEKNRVGKAIYSSNAWLINSTGEIKANFFADDAIQDIIVTKDFIVVTQFDEGAIGGDGVLIFDLKGNRLFGYSDVFGAESVTIYDCYAACLVGDNQIIFCPYTEFPLVLFDIEAKTQRIWEAPQIVHGFNAITKRKDKIYFHHSYTDKFAIYEWQIGTDKAERIGEYPNYFVRGLPDGRFLAKGDAGYTIISLN